MVAEDVCNKNVQHIGKFSARGSKASKRVVAPSQEQGETSRFTRQKAAANPSLAVVTHHALASTNTTINQNEGHINNNDEGKCLCDLVTIYEMFLICLVDQSFWLYLFLS